MEEGRRAVRLVNRGIYFLQKLSPTQLTFSYASILPMLAQHFYDYFNELRDLFFGGKMSLF